MDLSCLLLIILSSLLLLLPTPTSSTGLGINYGQIANNLPHPQSVVPLIKSIGAARLKLYDADPNVLKAFANTGVEFIIGLGNEHLAEMQNPDQALSWVKSNVNCYLPNTKITYISVGNEVLTLNDSALSSTLVPAMANIHTALVSLNLHNQVSVTTSHNFGVLQVSYPPSAGVFQPQFIQTLTAVLDFHSKTNSPFLINAYPYFAFKNNENSNAGGYKQVLDFALFQGDGVVDPGSGLHYSNMFHAQIDAAHYAMDKIGYKSVCLQVSETGWPSKGDPDEVGATPENARKYNANVLKLIQQRKGTPLRPNWNMNVYVFALFNENQKPGPASERNFGLFKPDGTAVYDLGFNVNGGGSGSAPTPNTTTGGSGGTPPSGVFPVGGGPSDGYGYLPITDHAVKIPSQWALSLLCLIFSLVLTKYHM